MNRKWRLDVLSAVVLVLIPAALVWFKGEIVGIHTPDQRAAAILILCAILVATLLGFSVEHSRRLSVARLRLERWVQLHAGRAERDAHGASTHLERERASRLVEALRQRHGWRWRYREPWLVVVGDEALVDSVVPGLPDAGYMIIGNVVLLYARRSGDQLDATWFEQIRRVRRRRPADAMIFVVQTRDVAEGLLERDPFAHRLEPIVRVLGWSAPAYIVNVTRTVSGVPVRDEAIGRTWSKARLHLDALGTSLSGLAHELADAGVARLATDPDDRYPAQTSEYIARHRQALTRLVEQISQPTVSRAGVRGIFFTPLPDTRETEGNSSRGERAGFDNTEPDNERERTSPMATSHAWLASAVWQAIGIHSRRIHGRRVGFSFSTAAGWLATICIACWVTGTILSGASNRSTLRIAAATTAMLTKARATQDPTQAALALDSLQEQLDTLEIRRRDGAPWSTRFGLNHDAELFAALWPAYEVASSRIVVQPIRAMLEARLRNLNTQSDAEIARGANQQAQLAHATLKSYLMLAEPERADATFLAPQLLATAEPGRPRHSPLSEGAWQDLRRRLVTFYTAHLGGRVSPGGASPLAIVPDASLIRAVRRTLMSALGLQNSIEVIYQQILDENRRHYPPTSLAMLLGDTSSRGLFNTTATLPGVFTRAAWDERIAKSIAEAGEQRGVGGDWVLSDTQPSKPSPSTLAAELRQRYFDDCARNWQQFLNSIRWQPERSLSGTIDQLTLLADPQRSPLAALMKAVVYQAGSGATGESLADRLINKTQQLVGAAAQWPSEAVAAQRIAPLAAAFGPLLNLTGSDLADPDSSKSSARLAAMGDLSLQRYRERVTAMRLRLQQIMASDDPGATSRVAAQAVLQGRTSDIAESRDYASRVAASLGEQWAGFGDLLQRPLEQSWEVVLQPSASSLNETWRNGIVADWNRAFAGRYPFADSDNDASLPELGRFMRTDSGVIARFVTTQLAGVVERQGDRWVLAQRPSRSSLTVDPNFLAALNQLDQVSTTLFASGDAQIRFELRGVATPGVTDTRFVLSGRELHYFNQQEEWTLFVWPGDALENISRIEWQTEQGGWRTALDAQGRFGLIRLLEHASVTPQDRARYLVSWTPDQRAGPALKVQLRSDVGQGPLDVLGLRHFTLPTRIFLTDGVKIAQRQARKPADFWQTSQLIPQPPPLPPAAIAAAKHAAMPLPHAAQEAE